MKAAVTSTITTLVQEKRWLGSEIWLKRAAKAVCKAEKTKTVSVTLVLANDRRVKKLNALFRGKNKPTNVLSFPDGHKEGKAIHLGDVVLAYETIAREARLQKKEFKAHAMHLTVHGVLHLLGYDHEKPKEAEKMESREIDILNGLRVANPYVEV